jgi:hypothetical protein
MASARTSTESQNSSFHCFHSFRPLHERHSPLTKARATRGTCRETFAARAGPEARVSAVRRPSLPVTTTPRSSRCKADVLAPPPRRKHAVPPRGGASVLVLGQVGGTPAWPRATLSPPRGRSPHDASAPACLAASSKKQKNKTMGKVRSCLRCGRSLCSLVNATHRATARGSQRHAIFKFCSFWRRHERRTRAACATASRSSADTVLSSFFCLTHQFDFFANFLFLASLSAPRGGSPPASSSRLEFGLHF